jgi:hypothetical protein
MTGFKSGWDFIRFSDAVLSRYDPASIPRTADSCSFQAALEVCG